MAPPPNSIVSDANVTKPVQLRYDSMCVLFLFLFINIISLWISTILKLLPIYLKSPQKASFLLILASLKQQLAQKKKSIS